MLSELRLVVALHVRVDERVETSTCGGEAVHLRDVPGTGTTVGVEVQGVVVELDLDIPRPSLVSGHPRVASQVCVGNHERDPICPIAGLAARGCHVLTRPDQWRDNPRSHRDTGRFEALGEGATKRSSPGVPSFCARSSLRRLGSSTPSSEKLTRIPMGSCVKMCPRGTGACAQKDRQWT